MWRDTDRSLWLALAHWLNPYLTRFCPDTRYFTMQYRVVRSSHIPWGRLAVRRLISHDSFALLCCYNLLAFIRSLYVQLLMWLLLLLLFHCVLYNISNIVHTKLSATACKWLGYFKMHFFSQFTRCFVQFVHFKKRKNRDKIKFLEKCEK